MIKLEKFKAAFKEVVIYLFVVHLKPCLTGVIVCDTLNPIDSLTKVKMMKRNIPFITDEGLETYLYR